MDKDFGVRPLRLQAISEHILNAPVEHGNTEWENQIEKIIPLVPAAEYLSIKALESVLKSPLSALEVNAPIPILDEDTQKLIIHSLQPGADTVMDRAESRRHLLELSRSYLDVEDLKNLTTVADEAVSLLPATVIAILEKPEDVQKHWEFVITQIRERLAPKIELERRKKELRRQNLEAKKLMKKEQQEIQRPIDNEKWMPRILLTFPELANNPWAGHIYQDRHRIATNVAMLDIIYHNTPDTVPANDYDRVFRLLHRHLPAMAMKYPIKLRPEIRQTYSKDELHNLYLYLINATTLAFDSPLGDDIIPGKIESELSQIIDFELGYLRESAKYGIEVASEIDQLNAKSKPVESRMTPIEQLMRRLWGKLRVPKLDVNLYQNCVDPLIWKEKIVTLDEQRDIDIRHQMIFQSHGPIIPPPVDIPFYDPSNYDI